MPFLTFQKVKNHRALRQAIRVVDVIVSLNDDELINLKSNYSESIQELTAGMTRLRKVARQKILITERNIGLKLLGPDSDGTKSVELIKKGCLTSMRNIPHDGTVFDTKLLCDNLTKLRNTKLFCTHETMEWMERFHDAIKLYEQIPLVGSPEEPSSDLFKHELLLLYYYTKPEDPKGLHVSRTLDQYYYSALSDTLCRDMDQVVRRYQAKRLKEDDKRRNERDRDEKTQKMDESDQLHLGSKYNKKRKKKMEGKKNRKMKDFRYQDDPEAKIGMVDQLWLWIIDESKCLLLS
jgi:hypothetical protein